jgi:hypothetical protein
MADVTDYTQIYLSPSCEKCKGEERTWCQSDVYDPCPECGRVSTCYLAADQVHALMEQVRQAGF